MTFRRLDKKFLEENIDDFLKLIEGFEYLTWKAENFLYELPKKWDFSFAIFDEGKLVGFCLASNKISDVYYMHFTFISAEVRGKGFGKKIWDHAKQVALEHGIHKIEFRCPESNKGPIELYKRLGYQHIDTLKDDLSGEEADLYFQLKF